MTFWERFFELCNENGKKPNPLAKELGISSGAVTKWKTGGIPSGETLLKLSEFFDCSIDYLLGKTVIRKSEDLSNDFKIMKLILNYNQLNNLGKTKLVDYSDDLISSSKYIESQKEKHA